MSCSEQAEDVLRCRDGKTSIDRCERWSRVSEDIELVVVVRKDELEIPFWARARCMLRRERA
jgi:hypothetical protein